MKCSQMAVAAQRGSTGTGSCFAVITMEMEASIRQETEKNCALPIGWPGLLGLDKNAEKPEEKRLGLELGRQTIWEADQPLGSQGQQ